MTETTTLAPGAIRRVAHTAHQSHAPSLLPPALFLTGLAVLAASVALDARGSIDRRLADAGVAVGVGCLLVGAVTLVV